MALEYCTKVECKEASRSFVEDNKDRDIKRYQDLEESPTYTYINWLHDIIFLECDDCSFNKAIDFLHNDLQKTRYLLLDTGFSRGNPEISTQLSAVRQLGYSPPWLGKLGLKRASYFRDPFV